MADSNNPGQFGNRDDTEDQAKRGGQASSGQFGRENGADPQQAAEVQPTEAKREGGENSHGGGRHEEDGEDESE